MSRPTVHELTHSGLLQFSGADAQSFLQGQLTCDVARLAPGCATYGAHCTPKGRVLASFLLWRTADAFWMQLPVMLVARVREQLSRYILRAKVKADDVSGHWKLFGITGPDATRQAQSATGSAPPALLAVSEGRGVMVVRLPGDRYLVATRETLDRVQEHFSAGAGHAGADSWELEEIRAGIPSILPSTQETFVPQMVNLDLVGGVSFDKGCYPGQEIVARMHYRGTLKQRMYRAGIAGAERPQPGDKLYSSDFGEQSCGAIVNASPAPEGGFDVLAVIQIAATGGDVRWRSPQGPTLKLLPLPYSVEADR